MTEPKPPQPETTTLSREQLARAELDAFISNPGLAEMASLFHEEELPIDPHQKLATLQTIAENYWDFRKGAERQSVDWNDELLDQEGSQQWNTIFEGSDELGLVRNTEPVNKKPNTLAFLGGMNRAPFDRLRYGLEKVEDFDQVAYLGSSRKVSDAERQKAADYAPNAQTEFDLGCGAFEKLLGAKKIDELSVKRDGDIWVMRVYEFVHKGEKKRGFALSTPQTIGEQRATTYDNLRFFADSLELSNAPNHTVVTATTGHYTSFQHLSAVQELTLKHGTKVETIGHSAEFSGMVRKPAQLLQETKSAIDAAVRLEQAIEQQAA